MTFVNCHFPTNYHKVDVHFYYFQIENFGKSVGEKKPEMLLFADATSANVGNGVGGRACEVHERCQFSSSKFCIDQIGIAKFPSNF